MPKFVPTTTANTRKPVYGRIIFKSLATGFAGDRGSTYRERKIYGQIYLHPWPIFKLLPLGLKALSWLHYFLSSTSQIYFTETSYQRIATLIQVSSSMQMMALWLFPIQTLLLHTKSCFKCANTYMCGVVNGN